MGEASLPFGIQNSQALFAELDALFKTSGIDRKTLKLIVCGSGPGSYTGMRVAAATAKALSFALKIPLVGVSTLTGLLPSKEGGFAALSDAKISGVYLLKGVREREEVRYLCEPMAVSIPDLAPHLQDVSTLVTLSASLHAKVASELPWEETHLSAQAMMRQALIKYSQGIAPFEILYLRKTQAELERCL